MPGPPDADDMKPFDEIVFGEEYQNWEAERFEDGVLKPEYQSCPSCGKPESGGLCDECLERTVEDGDDGLYDV